ncbi:MAG: hypothetical protein AB1925_15675 [Actinomycetota bacterium]
MTPERNPAEDRAAKQRAAEALRTAPRNLAGQSRRMETSPTLRSGASSGSDSRVQRAAELQRRLRP